MVGRPKTVHIECSGALGVAVKRSLPSRILFGRVEQWSARHPVTVEVAGSNPVTVAVTQSASVTNGARTIRKKTPSTQHVVCLAENCEAVINVVTFEERRKLGR